MTATEALKDFPLRWVVYPLSKPRFLANQRAIIEELAAADEQFPARLRRAALMAIQSRDAEVVRCGLSALAFVGTLDDLPAVGTLELHGSSMVQREMRTCLFEIKHRPPA